MARLVLVDGIDGGGQRVIVDPEDWRKRTGKPHAINYFEVSPDLRFVAVGISESGAEIGSLHLFDLATAKPVEAPITRIWFGVRSEEHTSELQSLMRNSYAVFRL